MTTSAIDYDGLYTWEQYRTWPDNERWELVDGHAYDMSPSPACRHQDIVTKFAGAMSPFFQGKHCRLFVAPMDVKLSECDVVQPDLLVVCNEKQITRTHIEGPPDLVIEVLSKSTFQHDRRIKMNLYAQSGVKEYWLVTQLPGFIEIFQLNNGHYTYWDAFRQEDTIHSAIFPDLSFPLQSIFDFPLDEEEQEQETLRVKEETELYGKYIPNSHR